MQNKSTLYIPPSAAGKIPRSDVVKFSDSMQDGKNYTVFQCAHCSKYAVVRADESIPFIEGEGVCCFCLERTKIEVRDGRDVKIIEKIMRPVPKLTPILASHGCLCSKGKPQCEYCRAIEATFPDVLINRAAELGLSLDDYCSVEELERGISAAEALRQNDEE